MERFEEFRDQILPILLPCGVRKNDAIYLHHILDAIDRIREYTAGVSAV
ncbi:MAG: hypothetical protein QHJ81_02615 [Anaerolineae bacterium]|nr:hypothetical protein [Anaerolineae bacterium]